MELPTVAWQQLPTDWQPCGSSLWTPGLSKENLLLNPDFRDMLSGLCEEKAEFLLVGAYALAVHGLPRASGDIDIWIQPTEINAHRVWRALERFGAPLQDLRLSDLTQRGIVIQSGPA